MLKDRKFVNVVFSGGHEIFFDRYLQAVNVKQLIIISPWITSLKNEKITMNDILYKVQHEKINTTILMRDPKKETINYDVAEQIMKSQYVSLYYNNEIHAKVYICRCDPFGFALIGSANLSGNATRAHEIGLIIEGIGRGQEIIVELEKIGTEDLLNRAGTIKILK